MRPPTGCLEHLIVLFERRAPERQAESRLVRDMEETTGELLDADGVVDREAGGPQRAGFSLEDVPARLRACRGESRSRRCSTKNGMEIGDRWAVDARSLPPEGLSVQTISSLVR